MGIERQAIKTIKQNNNNNWGAFIASIPYDIEVLWAKIFEQILETGEGYTNNNCNYSFHCVYPHAKYWL